jgi:outer membrane protein TolC
MRLLFAILLFPISLFAQISLDSCISQAYRHYQFDLEQSGITESGELMVKAAGTGYYPQLNLDYSSTYQNQQIEFPQPVLPGQEGLEVPLDFHRVLLNFSQNIYDGSMTASKKKVEKISSERQLSALEVEKTKIRAAVTRIYMGILLSKENLDIMKAKKEQVEQQLNRVEAAAEQGAVLPSEAKSLQAELLMIRQNETQVEAQKQNLIAQLSVQTGLELNSETEFAQPFTELTDKNFEQRPEIKLLRTEIKLIEAQKSLTSSVRMPKVRLFGSAGMGNPGYNILDNTFQPMGIIGIGVSWQIWDWKKAGNEKRMMSIRQSNLEYGINRQNIRLNADLVQQEMEIQKLENMMKEDEAIVALRKEVTEIKASQLGNGVITSSDYIMELNNQVVAELNQKIHELELIQARLNYNLIAGN